MTAPTNGMAYRAWLGQQISSLDDGEFIILTLQKPLVAAEPRRRGFFGRQERPAVAPYLQFLRIDEFLASECGGARSFGGPVDLTPHVDEQIRRLGWIPPHDPAHLNPSNGNYEHHWERTQADELAELAVETLKVLGAKEANDIDFERNQ